MKRLKRMKKRLKRATRLRQEGGGGKVEGK